MSTSSVLNEQTNSALPIKKETINFAVVVKLDENGKISKARHTSSEKDIAALESADYKGDEQLAFKQAVIASKVGTLEGFEELIPDADTRLDIINKGIMSKFNQKIRTTLIELDEAGNLAFQPVEPTYDATPLIQEPALRTNMSPLDKALKTLGGLDPATLAAALEAFSKANRPTEVSE